MVKDAQTVIEEFNNLVNMSASELDAWLKEDSSRSAGWSKNNHDDNHNHNHNNRSGETIGHESGRQIVEILTKNPSRDPGGYGDDDVDHMRRVVAYCKRHLAQEKGTAQRDPESRGARSLKNWGHDPAKA
ncbi:hypothetical protein F4775DRAFT_604650 [Biscogniauxia sp. FL1348]|nr:hypothetical protein F4775DRAFT_604650 [Biscogniauxia sp. FL1348]